MKKYEKIIVYPLLIIQTVVLIWAFYIFHGSIDISNRKIHTLFADQIIIQNEENEIIAMIGNVKENGHVVNVK